MSLQNCLSNWLWKAASACVLLLGFLGNAQGDIILFDDTQNQTPDAQPWLVYADDSLISGGSATQTGTSDGVDLVTDNAVSAGYSNYVPIFNEFKNDQFPTLDRVPGFRLGFELQINSESHSGSNDRAGFSVILLGADSQGIELGFWEDEIWAQNDDPLFTKGENVLFDTTQGEVSYELTISGDEYFLSADGNLLLSDSLRDYTAFGGAPYNLGSYLFLGDNTSSAQADISLGLVTITAIPEPSGLGLACCMLIGLALPLRRKLGKAIA